jgi:hypothetical protein
MSSLTTSDWTLFSNVVHAYDTFSLIPTLDRLIKNLSLPSHQVHFNTEDAVQMISSIYTSVYDHYETLFRFTGLVTSVLDLIKNIASVYVNNAPSPSYSINHRFLLY